MNNPIPRYTRTRSMTMSMCDSIHRLHSLMFFMKGLSFVTVRSPTSGNARGGTRTSMTATRWRLRFRAVALFKNRLPRRKRQTGRWRGRVLISDQDSTDGGTDANAGAQPSLRVARNSPSPSQRRLGRAPLTFLWNGVGAGLAGSKSECGILPKTATRRLVNLASQGGDFDLGQVNRGLALVR